VQMTEAVRSKSGRLRADNCEHVLEQDQRAVWVVGRGEWYRSARLVPDVFKAIKHQSLVEYTGALRLAQLAQAPPGVAESGGPARGGKSAQEDRVAIQDDWSPRPAR